VASLETAIDNWREISSLITLTEVATANRAQSLREKGWGYWNATAQGGRADDAGICWDKSVWREKQHWVRKLYGRFQSTNQVLSGLWATSALLQHTDSGHLLLVSCSHMPHDVEGKGGFKTVGDGWRARKEAYQSAMKAWSTHIQDLNRRKKPDALIVCGDWNINLKDNWFRSYMLNHWKPLDLKLAWKHFPTEGGSLGGNRIIDGTWYHGMSTDGAELMPRSASSDHRPYKERFTLGQIEPHDAYDPASGQIRPGKEWWGFGDYSYDQFFEQVRKDDDGNTIVTFDFGDLDPDQF
jgi:hypothetical protein